MYKRKGISLILIAFLMVFVLGPVNYASADAMDTLIGEIEELYSFADVDYENFNIPSLNAARIKLVGLSAEELDAVAADLVTDEVEAKYENDPELYDKDEWKKAITHFIAFSYLTDADSAKLKTNLEHFREKFSPHFKILFGEEITMDDLARLAEDTRGQIRSVVGVGAGQLANDDNDTMIQEMARYSYDALKAAAALEGNEMFVGKLADLGWDKTLLIEKQEVLAGFIDPDGDARRSLALMIIRSETEPIDGLEVAIGDILEHPVVSIMGEDATEFIGWYSMDEEVVEVTTDEGTGNFIITAVGSGTTELLAYRDYPFGVAGKENGSESEPLIDWLVRVNVTVEGEEASTVKGYASWYKIADNAGITVTAKSEEEEIVGTVETDEEGLFELALPDGIYTLELTVEGYLKTIVENVAVAGGNLVEVSTSDDPIVMSAGDLNESGLVDITDLVILTDAFGSNPENSNYLLAADFNRSRLVDITDLVHLADHFGEVVKIIVLE